MSVALGAVLVASLVSSCGVDTEPATTDSATHSVTTQFGTVEVPDRIESVVVIDGRRDLDIALAFDLPIVGIPVETELRRKSPAR
ncbi:hypothetical protein [Rhodococcus sp. BS-15]|uniref:hypothetical protein n=1 Tax=Rhodococcus sp. BS-15 TaxID=1304954 RepID=UPI000AC6ED49|nr:hypothetical protein [Rhodococcus sp. BS-15]